MRCFFIFVAILFSMGCVSAQTYKETTSVLKNLSGDSAVYRGRIILNDGKEESGMISYNDRTAVLTFRSDLKSGVYNARNLSGFEFFDSLTDRQRTFFSMEYEMRDGGARTSQFFEIVRQYKNFAVIIKTDPIAIRKKTGVVEATVLGDFERRRVVVSNAMTVYFLSEDLSVRPYLEVTSKDVSHINKIWGWDIFSGESTKVRILDRDLPKDLMGTSYKKVVSHMKKNDLHWNRRDELIAVLDYYNSLTEE